MHQRHYGQALLICLMSGYIKFGFINSELHKIQNADDPVILAFL